ncbi:hypothetical protein FGB62_218g018 [Gracilaria domingensis]|nr:hypothetical protein FGB62_218g018 [Gracilaria domingensis]
MSALQGGVDKCKLEQPSAPPPGPAPPCVETEWLNTNGFSDGILREGTMAKTLCMNGLPCGTEGHLLRVCDVNGVCALNSYKQVCEKHGDCKVKYTEVSRLSARVDWSAVKLDECLEDGSTVSLTSLSVDANDGEFGLSWGVAKAGEALIGAGLGGVVDVVAVGWEDIAKHGGEVVRMVTGVVGK